MSEFSIYFNKIPSNSGEFRQNSSCESRTEASVSIWNNGIAKSQSYKDKKKSKEYIAQQRGLTPTRRHGVYYDKGTNSYFEWNDEKKDFQKSAIEDVNRYGGYKIGDKYVSGGNKPINAKEFYCAKLGLGGTDDENIFKNYTTNVYYKWNAESTSFEEFDPDAEKNAFLNQKPDGVIDNFKQGNIGDCWLLSAINALSLNEDGRKLIKDIVKTDENQNLQVNLKGANKTYTISNEELEKAIAEERYAFGDKDVVAIELAVEKFRTEIVSENKLSRNNESVNYLPRYTEGYMLEGGIPKNALELLTGKNASSLRPTRDENVLLKDNVAVMGKMEDDYLKNYFEDKNSIVLVSLKTDEPGYADGHTYTFKSFDEKNVYLINPQNTSEITSVPKDEFYSKILRIDYTKLDTPLDTNKGKAAFSPVEYSPEVKKYLKEKQNS